MPWQWQAFGKPISRRPQTGITRITDTFEIIYSIDAGALSVPPPADRILTGQVKEGPFRQLPAR